MTTVGLMDLVFRWRASQRSAGGLEERSRRNPSSESEFRGRRQEVDLG
jgi:hypothetical protein